LKAVSKWAVKEGLSVYDARSHSGLLRHLVVREAKNGTDRLVLLVTAGWQLPEESFIKAVLDSYPATSILRGTNDKLSDTAIPDSQEILFGPGWITETLRVENRSLNFRVSPQSFFQSNTRGAEILHSFLRDKIRGISPKLILDLYCGSGAITLSVADLCEKVIGLECVDAAVVDANFNARSNGVLNASFYSGLVEVLLPALLAMKPDMLIMDPPRSGIHPRTLDILAKAKVPAIIYVSCNPKTLVRDLEVLLSRYEVKSFEAFDFFPHTEHVETAALLTLR
jgi:23S rRNA (uracil-5-)-methyltransferase RumA